MRHVGGVDGHGRQARAPVRPEVAHVVEVSAHLREVNRLVEGGRENLARADCQGMEVSSAVWGVRDHAHQVRGRAGHRRAHVQVAAPLRDASGRMRKMSSECV